MHHLQRLFPGWLVMFAVLGGCAEARRAGDVAAFTQPGPAALTLYELRCEYLRNPLAVEDERPRLSWRLTATERGERQTAYQVLAATRPDLLHPGVADLWDSGAVRSGRGVGIEYAGRRVAPGETVHWVVRVWDREGRSSPWSAPARWERALLDGADASAWICADTPDPSRHEDFFGPHPAPMFRTGFRVERSVVRARACVSGLGYYELHLNGARVGDAVLDPGWTDYAKRVLYATYDVTAHLRPGDNTVGLIAGNGWYNILPLWGWGSENRNLRKHLPQGRPRVLLHLELEHADGTKEVVRTDPTWQWSDSPIVFNSHFIGEEYDARMEQPGWDKPGFDYSAWKPAVRATEPTGPLRAQTAPSIRVTRTLKPVAITEPAPGRFVFDFGQNFAGVVRLRVRGPRGTTITLRQGEILFPDGNVNFRTSAAMQIKPEGAPGGPGAPTDAYQTDRYTLRGEGDEVFTPRFTFHGFRYVEMTGFPGTPTLEALEGLRLNSDVEPAGAFECSNPLFNRIHDAVQWTLLSNLFSVQSDCPHREKFGYGGDLAAACDMGLMNYDMSTFYAKSVRDLADAQRANGGFTETAPYVGIADDGLGDGAGPVEWGTAHPLVCWKLFQHYGDLRMLEEQFPAIERWMRLLESKAVDGILANGIGDHESLVPKSVPVTGTAFYALNADLAARIAGLLGHERRRRYYTHLADSIRDAFIKKFLVPGSGRIDSGTQCNQATALALGLVPERYRPAVLDVLVNDIVTARAGHLTTGIFGTDFMLRVLSESGRADVAYLVANQRTFPGWGHMLENAATTLWETWAFSDNIYSHNHPMFGSIDAWFYQYLAGIRPADNAAGFNRIVIRPRMVDGLSWVKAHHDCVLGRIASQWRIEGARLRMRVVIPAGATALVYVPARRPSDVRESGRPAGDSAGVELLGADGDALVYRVGSGEYVFESEGWRTPAAMIAVPVGAP